MKPVIVLRPEPGNGRTAAAAERMGMRAVRCPLFRARALPWTPPDAALFDALMVTSAQAARLAGPDLARYRHLTAYAVGPATAAALREQGFAQIIAGTGDAAALRDIMLREGRRHVLHLSGTDVASSGDDGRTRPITARIAVYTMAEKAAADPADGTQDGAVLLVHSPRAGERLAILVPAPERDRLDIVAISPAALHACGDGWASLHAAPTPDDNAMLALALSLCKNAGTDGRDSPAP